MVCSFFFGAVYITSSSENSSVVTPIHTTNQAEISSYLYLDHTHKSDSNNQSNMACKQKHPPTLFL